MGKCSLQDSSQCSLQDYVHQRIFATRNLSIKNFNACRSPRGMRNGSDSELQSDREVQNATESNTKMDCKRHWKESQTRMLANLEAISPKRRLIQQWTA